MGDHAKRGLENFTYEITSNVCGIHIIRMYKQFRFSDEMKSLNRQYPVVSLGKIRPPSQLNLEMRDTYCHCSYVRASFFLVYFNIIT